MLGRFMVDPSYTDFIVVANDEQAPSIADEDVGGMPDWAIAVVVIGLGSFAFVIVFGITVMSNKRRRSSKKKHEVPLTEDMLNELNKASLGHQGYMMHGNNHHGMGYDNYGQDPDDFFDSDDVWNNDKYYQGQQRYKRQSNVPQQQSQQHQHQQQHQSSRNSKSNPYQSQLYDSWRTEWNAPYYDQYRSGPSGASSSAEAVNHSGGGRSAYMTKGGRRLSYEDDF